MRKVAGLLLLQTAIGVGVYAAAPGLWQSLWHEDVVFSMVKFDCVGGPHDGACVSFFVQHLQQPPEWSGIDIVFDADPQSLTYGEFDEAETDIPVAFDGDLPFGQQIRQGPDIVGLGVGDFMLIGDPVVNDPASVEGAQFIWSASNQQYLLTRIWTVPNGDDE